MKPWIAPVFCALATLAPFASDTRTAACASGVPIVIRNVNVLSMMEPRSAVQPVEPTYVRVDGARITAIAPSMPTAGVCVIDGAGGTLMPGLADMHAHTDASEMPLFLANGVTLVREMNGTPTSLALRDRIARGDLIAPRLLVTSPLLTANVFPVRHRLIKSTEDARVAAAEVVAARYDYFKIYDGLTKDEYNVFVEAGRAARIPLDGHVPADVGLAGVIAAGQSIQHMDKIAFALAGHSMDTTKLADVRRLFDGKRVWVTPTLASLRALDMARTSEYAARLRGAEMAYVDSGSLGWWRSLSGTSAPRPPSAFFRVQVAVLAKLRATDARYLLGTDAANPLMVAGFSVHDELELLVREAGFTPYDALAMATRNVGEFLNDTTVGRIAVGARADLVLVRGDPLADVAVTRAPAGVMRGGRWLDRTALDSILASAKR